VLRAPINMKLQRILVTGGAGFVGTHLTQELVKRGAKVRVLDNLDPQVHGKARGRPRLLPRAVEWIKGDVTNPRTVQRALKGVDAVYHLAAAVGVGQSMYRIRHYVHVNSMGGATMLEAIVGNRQRMKKVVVASSMSIYGEGAYRCRTHGLLHPMLRSDQQLEQRKWEFSCEQCGAALESVPTPETKPLNPTSVYAVTKRDHEENFLAVGRSYGIPTVALRFFNIYGPYQALSNPYTGVAAIFSGRLLNKQAPVVFEDGQQSRDFIHVSDIVQACVLALSKDEANDEVFNVGTGLPTSVLRMAELLAGHLKARIKPELLNKFRAGDIRHCYADVTKIRQRLGFSPRVRIEDGVADLVAWVARQSGRDRVPQAVGELNRMGLVK
jgi:dTDP-L-rhamnose 4-epimerase